MFLTKENEKSETKIDILCATGGALAKGQGPTAKNQSSRPY